MKAGGEAGSPWGESGQYYTTICSTSGPTAGIECAVLLFHKEHAGLPLVVEVMC